MAKRRKTTRAIDNPRKLGGHVSKVIDYLETIGASDVSVVCNKHLRVSFKFHEAEFWFMLSSSPKSEDECANVARQDIRRTIRAKFQEHC